VTGCRAPARRLVSPVVTLSAVSTSYAASRYVAVLVGDNAAELPRVADLPFACEPKAGVKLLVPDVDALVRTLGVVIVEPDADDVVQLLAAEAAEMVQARMLEPSNN